MAWRAKGLQHGNYVRFLRLQALTCRSDIVFYSSANTINGGHNSAGENSHQTKNRTSTAAILAASVGFGLAWSLMHKRSECKQFKEDLSKYGKRIDKMPTYRKQDVEQHNTMDKRIWVTFRHGVYDVTDFVIGHPGGTKILLAAGKGLEAFFATYGVHYKGEVLDILEELRVGNIHPDDMKVTTTKDTNDPFANDPQRHPALQINSEKPFNGEPPLELLTDYFCTPNDLFFVRNHLPVPKIDSKKFRLEVSGVGMARPISFSPDELKSTFHTHKIAAAVQCAGNRRSNMASYKPVRGLNWGSAAISNAEWTGVKLVDVLTYAGVKEDDVGHVIFQGLDKDIEGSHYEASIPAASAMDPRKDVMIVFEMNGKPLPLDHGYPLRIIAPGIAGARQVKWVHKIVLSKEESTSHWQRNDYKSFNPSIDWNTLDYDKAVPIQEYPIQSAICEPKEGAVLEDDSVTVKGYAWSGGGRGIIRVEVSADGGKTWRDADLRQATQPLHRQWAWTLWEITIPLPEGYKGPVELICKAIDTSHNQQPESAEGIWNVRGLIHNAWHRVKVEVE